MTFRSFLFWAVAILVLGGIAFWGYIVIVNEATSRVNTEASVDGVSYTSIPRSGVITAYDTEKGVVFFTEAESDAPQEVRIDERTIIRNSVATGEFLDATFDTFKVGSIIAVTIDALEADTAAGAVDVMEIQS